MPARGHLPPFFFGAQFSPNNVPGLVADYPVANVRSLVGSDSSVAFDGTGGFLSSTNTSLRINPSVGFTICFWLFNNNMPSSSKPILIQQAFTGGGFEIDLNNGCRFLVANSAGSLVGNVSLGGSAYPQVNEWEFIACQVNISANTVSIRKNRQPVISASLTGTPAAGTSTLQVGAEGSAPYLIGSISGLAISQQVLTQSQIDILFGTPGGVLWTNIPGGLQSALSGYWQFTESSGNRLDSKSGIALAPSGTVALGTGPYSPFPSTNGANLNWWLDNSTARNDLSQSVVLNQPSYCQAAHSLTGRQAAFFAGYADGASQTVGMADSGRTSFSTQGVTLVAAGRAQNRSTIHDYVEVGAATAGTYAVIQQGAAGAYGNVTGQGNPGGINVATSYPYIRTRYSDLRFFICGTSESSVVRNTDAQIVGAPITSSTATGIHVGQCDGFASDEYFERVLVYNRALMTSEVSYLQNGLRLLYPFPVVSTTLPRVFWTGNSIHYGVSTSTVQTDIPYVTSMNTLGLPLGIQWIDFSVPSQTTPFFTANDPASLAPYRVDGTLTVVCFTEITNDIYLGGATALQAYNHIQAYVAAIKATLPTAPIVITTCLPRGASNQNTTRNAANALLRADFATTTAYSYVFKGSASWNTNCVLADWAAQPTMGPNGANLNATYYDSFQIHPIDAGVLLLAPISANALQVAGIP